MSRTVPRLPVHRGVVNASGFLVETGLTGEREARNRVLALWTPGAQVYHLGDGWLVRLPRPVRVSCDRAPGLPLVEEKVLGARVLVALPLPVRDLEALNPGDGAVVRLRKGSLVADLPSSKELVDPADWLGVEGFGIVATASLGDPPAEPEAREEEAAAFDPRAHLTGVPPADPRLQNVLAALGKTKPTDGTDARRRPRTSRGGAVAHWLHGVGSTLWGLLRKPAPGEARESRRPLSGAADAPSLSGRIADSLHRVLSRMVLASRLSRLVGRRHAAYIQRMMEMFERGDVQEALRLAIPLGGPSGEALRGLPLRRPPRRQDLRIRPQETRTWAVVGLAPDLFTELQRLYRDAFHRLESQERFEEAAFLLAEVLQANEEAVAFLERHGRLRLAAEMAEARDLPPGLVVRQWFLAGDRRRALRIARRTGTFADAVARLERSRRPEEARELRLLWAEGLAQGGDYAAAVEVVWPLPDTRDLALAWMDRAIDQGGPSAGRMLAKKLSAAPEQFEKIREKVVAMLESWRAEGAAARLAFADSLRQGPRTPEAMTLARAAVRAIARDSGSLGARMPPAEFHQLVTFAGDGSLRADAPALPLARRTAWTLKDEVWRVEVAAPDAGTMPVYDAAFLPSGLTAVALGEAGVRLVSRARRTVAEIDQPAHRLVVSDHGDRALVLARRGDSWRLARIDFPSRKAEVWCDARIGAFAPDYDGFHWFVASEQGLTAVETTGQRFDGPWGASDLPGSVRAVARSTSQCSLIVAGEAPEVWTWALPSFTLRSRGAVSPPHPADPFHSRHLAVTPDGTFVEQSIGFTAGAQLALKLQVHDRFELDIPLPGEGWASEPVVSAAWIASPVHDPEGTRVYLIHMDTGRVRAEVALARAGRVTLRLTPQDFTVVDDRGRVVILDLENGQMRRDLRL
jgi:hypothetical protein